MYILWHLTASPPPPSRGADPAWIIAMIALVSAIAGCVAWATRWGWRILKRVTHFLDDYFGQPARDGLPEQPGVMARLASVEKLIGRVVTETQPNHGNSLRDALHQVAGDVTVIKREQADMRHRMEQFETQRAGREGNT